MWVGGCVTAPTAWASPPGRRTQECTQIGGNGPSGPFRGICVHCCAVGLGCGWPWDRNSVHKWEDRASPHRIGAFVYTVGLLRCCGQMRGRNSVHRSPKTASPHRIGAFVYTVGLLWTNVGTQECTQIGQNGLSAPFWGICVHCCDASRDTNCDASCVRWHERLSRHGVSAAPPPRWPLPLGREDRL